MGIVLKNALLADLDPARVERGGLRIEGGRIVERGAAASELPGDEVVDCGGAVVLPGLVNGHAHLYSALAAGMPAPPPAPQNFVQTLEYVWWRLDRALDALSIETSGRVGALDAVRCGTTTLIDHHASPECIDCSLDFLERGVADVGLRAVLCYETTDRNGRAGREAGIEENHRYLEKRRAEPSTQFAGMVGAHALFTLEDETLDLLAELAERFETGVHVHVAEDAADEAACREQHGVALVERLAAHGLLNAKAVFVHGTCLDAEALARVGAAGVTLAHNPRSNMNNAVGYAPVATYGGPVMLGTDGIGSDMFAEAQAAWWIARHEHAALSPAAILGMLATNARRASASLGVTLGKLEVGAAADVVLTDWQPATPLTSENLAGQFIFALRGSCVASVVVDGKWVLRERTVVMCDEAGARTAAQDVARAMWGRMAELA